MDQALRRVLGCLLEAVQRNEEGTRRDLDSEFLHDFRVAVRRCRSALSQVKGVLPTPTVARLRRELKWLGNRTGPTRDLDVYLLKMDDYKAALPAAVARDLEPLDSFLHRHQRQEQRRLVRSLNSRRYRRLLETWRRAAEAEAPEETETEETPNATRPVREVAVERIARALARVLKKGGKIDRDTPAEAVHRLRIDCKKLRYLLEIFAGVFDPEILQPPIKALKRLQDTLGDFNDFEVQQETLQRFAHQMVAEGLLEGSPEATRQGADTLLAMGRLQDHLAAGQAKERQRFHRRFDRFASPKVQRHFDHLLGAEA
jgi:CHAD domain-containing protein